MWASRSPRRVCMAAMYAVYVAAPADAGVSLQLDPAAYTFYGHGSSPPPARRRENRLYPRTIGARSDVAPAIAIIAQCTFPAATANMARQRNSPNQVRSTARCDGNTDACCVVQDSTTQNIDAVPVSYIYRCTDGMVPSGGSNVPNGVVTTLECDVTALGCTLAPPNDPVSDSAVVLVLPGTCVPVSEPAPSQGLNQT